MRAIAIILIVIVMALMILSATLIETETGDIYAEKAIDRRFTLPDEYEILYRKELPNGMGVEIWREVSKKEYETFK